MKFKKYSSFILGALSILLSSFHFLFGLIGILAIFCFIKNKKNVLSYIGITFGIIGILIVGYGYFLTDTLTTTEIIDIQFENNTFEQNIELCKNFDKEQAWYCYNKLFDKYPNEQTLLSGEICTEHIEHTNNVKCFYYLIQKNGQQICEETVDPTTCNEVAKMINLGKFS